MTGTQKVGQEGIELASPLLCIPLFSGMERGWMRSTDGCNSVPHREGGEKSPCVVNGNNQEGGAMLHFEWPCQCLL